MYFPGLSFIVLKTCWKFCSNVSPISSISIPCFCSLAYKIKLYPFFARKDRLIKMCLLFLTLWKFYILCANNVVLTLNILSVHTVFYFKHPECSHSLPTMNISSVDKMMLRCYPTLNTPKFFSLSCLLYMYLEHPDCSCCFTTLNILNVHVVFLPWTSWALWGPCHPVGPYRTVEGRCRHWPGSGPYWILSIGMKARKGHLHTRCNTCMSKTRIVNFFIGETLESQCGRHLIAIHPLHVKACTFSFYFYTENSNSILLLLSYFQSTSFRRI